MSQHSDDDEQSPEDLLNWVQQDHATMDEKSVQFRELFFHYRRRVVWQEQECSKQLYSRLEELNQSRTNLNDARWGLLVKVEESAQLHNALTEASIQLFRERQLILDLLTQNDQLRVQEMDDRRRVKHLLDLAKDQEKLRETSGDGTKEITFFRDCRPMLLDKGTGGEPKYKGLNMVARKTRKGIPHIPNSVEVFGRHTNRRAKQREALQHRSTHRFAAAPAVNAVAFPKQTPRPASARQRNVVHAASHVRAGDHAKGVIRTIYLPNRHTDALLEQVERLQTSLETEKKRGGDTIHRIEADCQENELAARAKLKAQEVEMKAVGKELEYEEEKLFDTIKRLVEIHLQSKVKFRELVEENEMLETSGAAMDQELRGMKTRVARAVKAYKLEKAEQIEKDKKRLTLESREYDKMLCELRLVYDDHKKIGNNQVNSLTKKTEAAKKRLKHLKQRRLFDLEGFANDLTQISQQIAFVEDNFDQENRSNHVNVPGTSILDSCMVGGTGKEPRIRPPIVVPKGSNVCRDGLVQQLDDLKHRIAILTEQLDDGRE